MAVAEANVELARKAFAILSTDGLEAALPLFAEGFEMTTPPELASEPDTYRGADGIRRWFASFYEAVDEIRLEPGEIVDLGGPRIALSFELVSRGRTTGLELGQRAAMIVDFEEGLIRRFEFFATLEEALEAAGARG
jgi:ketosteroid isomerase-like protein